MIKVTVISDLHGQHEAVDQGGLFPATQEPRSQPFRQGQPHEAGGHLGGHQLHSEVEEGPREWRQQQHR